MKKFIIALCAIAVLTSCTGSSEEKVENKVDSVAVVPLVDTAAVVTNTIVPIDTVAAK